MKKAVFLLLAAVIFISCSQKKEQTDASDNKPTQMAQNIETNPRDGVFVHITESYGDPHRVLMPLKMANLMAQEKDVIVYMDIDAVELLVKGAADIKHPDFDSCQSYIKQLLDKHVGIYACPTCLAIAGYKPEDLREGIQVALKEKFFDFTKGRILTMNY